MPSITDNAATFPVDASGIAQGQLETPFLEQVVTQLVTTFRIRPTWGISDLRDVVTTTSTGSADTTGGLLRIQTGTTTGSDVEVSTLETGQYIPGGMGQIGIGVEVGTQPTGDGFVEWGYFGDEDGLGFGYDATGFYTFILRDSTKTKTRPADFTEGLPDGFDLAEGCITQINFSWYGFGSIEFFVQTTKRPGIDRMQLIHAFTPDGSSIIDPNQPIRLVANNGTGTQNVTAKFGGRQFSTTRAGGGERSRRTVEAVEFTTTSGVGNFQDVLAIRPKATFNGRPNSVRNAVTSFDIQADNDIEYEWVFGATITGATWAEAANYPAAETSVEFANSGVAAITGSGGIPFAKGYVLGGKQATPERSISLDSDLALGVSGTAYLRVKPLAADCDLFITTTVTEEW